MNGQAPAPVYYPPVNNPGYPTYASGQGDYHAGTLGAYPQQQQHINGNGNGNGLVHDRDPSHDSGYYGPGPAPPPASNGHAKHQPAPYHLQTNDADYGPYANTDFAQKEKKRLSKKWRKRLYWIVPLVLVGIAIVILFEVYKDDFLRWARPLEDWLRERQDWSWIIPVAILFILSFPPLFGHEIVQLIVGLVYPLGVAIGIAIAGAILGEAGCFLLFKYGFTGYVDRKCRKDMKWATVARVAQKEGFRGVMIIRYSIIPPHLANPLFAATGMTFWLYMVTVVLSLPKQIIFVVLGSPNNKGKTGAKVGKVIAFGVLAIITLLGTWYIRKRMAIARAEIEAERAAEQKGVPFNANGMAPMQETEGQTGNSYSVETAAPQQQQWPGEDQAVRSSAPPVPPRPNY